MKTRAIIKKVKPFRVEGRSSKPIRDHGIRDEPARYDEVDDTVDWTADYEDGLAHVNSFRDMKIYHHEVKA